MGAVGRLARPARLERSREEKNGVVIALLVGTGTHGGGLYVNY